MISVDGLGVEFSGQTLFEGVSFVVNENDKIALMGKNGTHQMVPRLTFSLLWPSHPLRKIC